MEQMNHTPPFTVTAEMMRLVADISELVGQLNMSVSEARMSHLRKERQRRPLAS